MTCPDAWIVDDSATARRLIEAIIGLAGFSARGFETGADAARAIVSADPPPAVAILDMQMPGLDGCQTARALRLAEYDGPIALFSACRGPALTRRALRSGVDEILHKDAGYESLRNYLSEITNREAADPSSADAAPPAATQAR